MPVHEINLLRHQKQLLNLPWQRPDLEAVFLIGGYASGKSRGACALVLEIARRYNGHHIACALFSTTIALFRKSMWQDLQKDLIQGGINYRYNQQDNCLTIGTVNFYVIPTEQPKLIYAYNVSISIVDEIGELEQSKCFDAFLAINERTRVPLPDGRKPFSAYTTTAQGLKGVYALTEDLKEKGIDFAIIRGHTKDNVYLDPAYYKRLYDLYTENERRAFLFGEFVNLTAGMVYPGFDEQVNVIDDIEPTEDDTIYIGQDLNLGFSKAVAKIVRDGCIYSIKDFSFKDISMAPQILRSTFPVQRIVWRPDASSKDIFNIQSYAAEIRAQDIEVRMANVNPSIVDRIFLVNKGFQTKKSFVCRQCKDLIMALKIRQYDDNGKPEKGQGEKAPDHLADANEYIDFFIFSTQKEFKSLYEATRTYRYENP